MAVRSTTLHPGTMAKQIRENAGTGGDARQIDYDNELSGLISDNVQDAIDEVHGEAEDALGALGEVRFGIQDGTRGYYDGGGDFCPFVKPAVIYDFLNLKRTSGTKLNIDMSDDPVISALDLTGYNAYINFTSFSKSSNSGTANFTMAFDRDAKTIELICSLAVYSTGNFSGQVILLSN